MKNQAFIDRWKSRDYLEVTSLVESYAKKGILNDLASRLGMISGKLDLRGYSVEGRAFQDCKFTNCDFSYAQFSDVRLERCLFENTVFLGALFDEVGDHANVYDNCIFNKCTWHACIVGYDGTKFTNCDFKNVRFKRMDFIRAQFLNCKFLQSKLANLDFNVSCFENVVFEGELINAWFRGQYAFGKNDEKKFGKFKKNLMKNVDFSKTKLRELEFSDGVPLDSIKLPEDKYIFYIKDYKKFAFEAYAHVDLAFKGVDLEVAKTHFKVLYDRSNQLDQKDTVIILYDAVSEGVSKDFLDKVFNYLKKLNLI